MFVSECARSRGKPRHLSPWLLSLILMTFITHCDSRDKVVAVVKEPVVVADPQPVVAVVRPGKSKLVSQLEARILALEQRDMDAKRIHRDIQLLQTDIGALKNSRALTHHLLRTTKEENSQNTAALDDKIETLKKEARRVEDAVMTLGELQKTLGDRLKKLADSQTASGLTIAMLSQSNKNMRSSLRQLASSSANHKTGIAELRKKVTELEVRFAGLSTDVMEKVANVDTMVGPDLKEIRSSQTNLAQSLSLLTKKMMLLSPKVPNLQRQLSANMGKVEELSRSLNDFQDKMSLITDRVGLTEHQLKTFLDPASQINSERRRLISKLRAEVSVLQDGQKKLKLDQIVEMADKDKLYKQIAGLRVSRKILVEKVAELEDAVDHFTHDLRHLILEGPRAKVVGHILSRQESALQALKSLRGAQIDIRHVLNEHGTAISGNQQAVADHDGELSADREAIRKVGERLVELFTHLQAVRHDMATSEELLSLESKHHGTETEVAGLINAHHEIQNDLNHYGTRIHIAEGKLVAAGKGLHQVEAELESLRRTTQSLHSAVKWKVNVHDKQMYADTLQRLGELRSRQEDVATILNDYSTALSSTQAELQSQRHAHRLGAMTTSALQNRLKDLHHRLALQRAHSSSRHESADLEAAKLKEEIAAMSDGLKDNRLEIVHAQHRLGTQAAVQVAQGSRATALRRKLAQLQVVVHNLRTAMEHPKTRVAQIHNTLALEKARQDIENVADELQHYKSALLNTHAEVASQRHNTARARLSTNQLWHQFKRLQAQLTALQEHSRVAPDDVERHTLHEMELAKAREDINAIASSLKSYNQALSHTRDSIQHQNKKQLLTDLKANDMLKQMKAQHHHVGALANAMQDAKMQHAAADAVDEALI